MFNVGDIVWFTGQCEPRLQGAERRTCRVVKVNDPDSKWMRSYKLVDLADGEFSDNNLPDMLEAKSA